MPSFATKSMRSTDALKDAGHGTTATTTASLPGLEVAEHTPLRILLPMVLPAEPRKVPNPADEEEVEEDLYLPTATGRGRRANPCEVIDSPFPVKCREEILAAVADPTTATTTTCETAGEVPVVGRPRSESRHHHPIFFSSRNDVGNSRCLLRWSDPCSIISNSSDNGGRGRDSSPTCAHKSAKGQSTFAAVNGAYSCIVLRYALPSLSTEARRGITREGSQQVLRFHSTATRDGGTCRATTCCVGNGPTCSEIDEGSGETAWKEEEEAEEERGAALAWQSDRGRHARERPLGGSNEEEEVSGEDDEEGAGDVGMSRRRRRSPQQKPPSPCDAADPARGVATDEEGLTAALSLPSFLLECQQLPSETEAQLLSHIFAYADAYLERAFASPPLAAAAAATTTTSASAAGTARSAHAPVRRGGHDEARGSRTPTPPTLPVPLPSPPPPFWIAAFAHTPRIHARATSYASQKALQYQHQHHHQHRRQRQRQTRGGRNGTSNAPGGGGGGAVMHVVATVGGGEGRQEHGDNDDDENDEEAVLVVVPWPDWVPPLETSLNILHAIHRSALLLMDDLAAALHRLPKLAPQPITVVDSDRAVKEEKSQEGSGGSGVSSVEPFTHFTEEVFGRRETAKVMQCFFRTLGIRLPSLPDSPSLCQGREQQQGQGQGQRKKQERQQQEREKQRQAMYDVAYGYAWDGVLGRHGVAADPEHANMVARIQQHCTFHSSHAAAAISTQDRRTSATGNASSSDNAPARRHSSLLLPFPSLLELLHFFALTWASREPFLHTIGAQLQDLLPRYGPTAAMAIAVSPSSSPPPPSAGVGMEAMVCAFVNGLSSSWRLWCSLAEVPRPVRPSPYSPEPPTNHGSRAGLADAPQKSTAAATSAWHHLTPDEEEEGKGGNNDNNSSINCRGSHGLPSGTAPLPLATRPMTTTTTTAARTLMKRAKTSTAATGTTNGRADAFRPASAALLAQRLSVLLNYTSTQCLYWFLLRHRRFSSCPSPCRHGGPTQQGHAVLHCASAGRGLEHHGRICADADCFAFALNMLPQLLHASLFPQEVTAALTRTLAILKGEDGMQPTGANTSSTDGEEEKEEALRHVALRYFMCVLCWAAFPGRTSSSLHESGEGRGGREGWDRPTHPCDITVIWREWLLPFFALHWHAPWWQQRQQRVSSQHGRCPQRQQQQQEGPQLSHHHHHPRNGSDDGATAKAASEVSGDSLFLLSAHNAVLAAASYYVAYTRRLIRVMKRQLRHQQQRQQQQQQQQQRQGDEEDKGVARDLTAAPAAAATGPNPWKRLGPQGSPAECGGMGHGGPRPAYELPPPCPATNQANTHDLGPSVPSAAARNAKDCTVCGGSSSSVARGRSHGTAGSALTGGVESVVSLGGDGADTSTAFSLPSSHHYPQQQQQWHQHEGSVGREDADGGDAGGSGSGGGGGGDARCEWSAMDRESFIEAHGEHLPWLSGRLGRVRKTHLGQLRATLDNMAACVPASGWEDHAQARPVDHRQRQQQHHNEKVKEREEEGELAGLCGLFSPSGPHAHTPASFDYLYSVLPPWLYNEHISSDSSSSVNSSPRTVDEEEDVVVVVSSLLTSSEKKDANAPRREKRYRTPRRGRHCNHGGSSSNGSNSPGASAREGSTQPPRSSRARLEGGGESDESLFVERSLFFTSPKTTVSSVSTVSLSPPSSS